MKKSWPKNSLNVEESTLRKEVRRKVQQGFNLTLGDNFNVEDKAECVSLWKNKDDTWSTYTRLQNIYIWLSVLH